MKILVTGSNGLVGNAIHKLLTNSDHEHINTSWSLGGIASHVIDITDNESIEKVVEEFRPDAIINSAAMANVDNCEVERDRCWKVNVEGTKTALEAADDAKVKMFSHMSSSAIFGLPEDMPITNNTARKPIEIYGEMILLFYAFP